VQPAVPGTRFDPGGRRLARRPLLEPGPHRVTPAQNPRRRARYAPWIRRRNRVPCVRQRCTMPAYAIPIRACRMISSGRSRMTSRSVLARSICLRVFTGFQAMSSHCLRPLHDAKRIAGWLGAYLQSQARRGSGPEDLNRHGFRQPSDDGEGRSAVWQYPPLRLRPRAAWPRHQRVRQPQAHRRCRYQC
jgi:hypothetical protein